MKHARAGANYVILAQRIKLQHEKNLASYLKSMQNVGFQQTSMKFSEIFLRKNNFLIGKNRIANHLSGYYWYFRYVLS